ncbi:testis-expressed protein 50 [Equus caballus]|uniref:testis expressed 50 precursor n=1 Tax=Equus caballus TaxID=9796 RepID=UPI000717D224|nr:testis-expressed protein 50 [Equus caballus]
MSFQGLSLIFPFLFICFFKETFCVCDGTIWTKVGWEILPEEMQYLKFKPSPSYCLPYPLNNLCFNFANMDIFQGYLYFTYTLVQALSFILFVLSVHYLWMKWKKHQKKLKKQPSLDTLGNDLEGPSFQDIDEILCRLMAKTSMLTTYLNQSSHYPLAKKVKHGKPKRKKTPSGGGARRYPYAHVTRSNMKVT